MKDIKVAGDTFIFAITLYAIMSMPGLFNHNIQISYYILMVLEKAFSIKLFKYFVKKSRIGTYQLGRIVID